VHPKQNEMKTNINSKYKNGI